MRGIVRRQNLEAAAELEAFDWINHKSSGKPLFPGQPISMFQAGSETTQDRQLRMLYQVKLACTACSMCELGLNGASSDGKLYRDPHVFSTMTPSKFMVVGQNPGWNEVCQGEPFVGQAGKNFSDELKKHNLSRADFYISNAVKCYTSSNQRPELRNVERCRPFLEIEINVLRPCFIVALGAVAFNSLCGDKSFSDHLGKLVRADKFSTGGYTANVIPIYHPSPLNMADKDRKAGFEHQIKIVAGLVMALR